ncbi:MAG: shikimate kinase [Flavobacteriia bacterium]|nr:shikimate kinase [Flavobacteriia bacterium]
MNLVLIGYMTSGKTTLGRRIASREGSTFVDLDEHIANQEGDSVSNLIRNKGELYFRKAERKALLEVLKGKDQVIAAGGGTPCYYDNMDEMLKDSVVVYLQWSISTLLERVRVERESRPLFDGVSDDDLPEYIAKHVFDRRPFYEKADHIVFCNGMSELDIINDIVNAWKNQ